MPDEHYSRLMAQALTIANNGAEKGEVPVGAVILKNGEILGEAHNLVEKKQDPCAHAEMLAIKEACQKVGNWRLEGCTICITLEPCPMCIGAIRLARIPLIIFGAKDPRMGAIGSLTDLSKVPHLGPVPQVISGVRERECSQIITDFFRHKRERKPVNWTY